MSVHGPSGSWGQEEPVTRDRLLRGTRRPPPLSQRFRGTPPLCEAWAGPCRRHVDPQENRGGDIHGGPPVDGTAGPAACTPPFPGSRPSPEREDTLSFTRLPLSARRAGAAGIPSVAPRGHVCTAVGGPSPPCLLSQTPEKLLTRAKGNRVQRANGTRSHRKTTKRPERLRTAEVQGCPLEPHGAVAASRGRVTRQCRLR